MKKLTIDMGKGVTISAPIKLDMNKDEWQRMVAHINKMIR